MAKIRVLVADTSPIFALGLTQVLSEDERVEAFDDAHNDRDVVGKAEELEPDIVLIDSQLPDHGGVRVTEMLQELHPEVKVIVLSAPENMEALLDSAMNAGAKGLLPRTISPMEMVKSIIEIAEGGAAISPRLMPLILEKLAARHGKPVVGPRLSAREMEVAELVAEGKSNREIAETMFISVNTVNGHLRKIMNKIGVNNRVEVARYVLLNGLNGKAL